MTEFMKIGEVAELLGVGTRRAYRMAQRGEIPSVRHGCSIRIPRRAWEQFVSEQAAASLAAMNREESTHAEAA